MHREKQAANQMTGELMTADMTQDAENEASLKKKNSFI